ncbi:PTS system mannose/fructose/sorbose family transporter subunit IID [Paramicrobacterium fandaimingii]|uniref:PTS system mannose/fructose/sorbose family transporter subunit IID n=1 Tax=Paramicrobacterium fandaimingii TaxID=2708079 RepID=UPI00141DED4D|nr:PTS system mannose/fructose/sorbose family transporter subunit IID [Microbacterium fandaimingii]
MTENETKAVDTTAPTEKEQRKEIRTLTWRGLLLQGAFNYERFQNLGFWWILRPMLDRLYPDEKSRAAAYRRHLAYFNTHPWTLGPITGIVATMERRRASGDEAVSDEAITSVKVGLMAPLAGIGDSLVFGTIRPIFSAVCAALAVNGNPLGPILFVLGLFAIQMGMRFWGTSLGYRTGMRFLDRLGGSELDRLKEGATVVGLAVTGALVATLLTVTTPFVYENGDASISLQDQLDTVLPAMIPLAATLCVFWLVRKRVALWLVLVGTVVVGVVAGYFGILA